jgi:Zn-dependent peptidase ImmA (M78 family)/DNA-binding XRE family transcriptional regulator
MRLGTPGFVGARLTQARETRGMTAAAVAELAAVTRQAIHQYEKGPHSPGHDVLTRLAAALGVPVHYFVKPMPELARTPAFARSMSAATKTARVRAERLLERVAELTGDLEQHAQLRPVDLPDLFPNLEDPTAVSFDEIENAASELRRTWEMGDGPISNVAWLLENRGIVVSRVAMEARELDGISSWINGRPYVLVNEDVPLARARFDLLHELGHVICHRHVPERVLRNQPAFKLIELQAHRFAAAFAFPQASFAREGVPLTLDRFLELKPRWRMSVKMMIHRAGDLRIASSDMLQTLYRRYNWRKWSRGEPFDDVWSPEIPRMLDKAATLIIERKAVGAADLQHQIGLSEREACALACLRRDSLAPLDAKIIPFSR